jgi:hypothetical protein
MLEFFVVPMGENRATANEAVWDFLATRGEGTMDRAQPDIDFRGKKLSGIRVTRDEMEAIRGSAGKFNFRFQILSINTETEEVRVHFSSVLSGAGTQQLCDQLATIKARRGK